jgi:hypothetical protein
MGNHPYQEHRDHTHSHKRVSHILKDHPAGATRHHTGAAFSHVNSKGDAASHDTKVSGRKAPKRFARGGKVKGHQTNIIVVPHHTPPVGGGPQAGAPPALPGGGAPAPMMPPPGGPPGLPPGMPPGGMPMRARGGKVGAHIDGEATKANLKKWSARASANKSYARGGAAKMTAGASTGVGRLEEANHLKRKGRK